MIKKYSSIIYLLVAIFLSLIFDSIISWPWTTDIDYIMLWPVGYLASIFLLPIMAIYWMRINRNRNTTTIAKILKISCYVFVFLALLWPLYILVRDIWYDIVDFGVYGWLRLKFDSSSGWLDNLRDVLYYTPYFIVSWLFLRAGQSVKNIDNNIDEDSENLINWLREAGQIPEEGESKKQFNKRVTKEDNS